MEELDYLIWLYQKSEGIYSQSKKLAKKDRAEGGTGMLIAGKEMADIRQQLRAFKHAIEDGKPDETQWMETVLKTLIRRLELEYCLDFLIWRFLRNSELIDENEAALIGYYAKKKRHDQLLKK